MSPEALKDSIPDQSPETSQALTPDTGTAEFDKKRPAGSISSPGRLTDLVQVVHAGINNQETADTDLPEKHENHSTASQERPHQDLTTGVIRYLRTHGYRHVGKK